MGYHSSDDLDGSSGDSTTPSVTIDSVEEVETSSPHAEFDVSWSASEDGGNLDSVSLQLRDVTAGEFEDSASNDVSGITATGTNRLSAHKDDGRGNDYEV